MQAIVQDRYGGPEVLINPGDRATRDRDKEVLVR